MPTPTTDFSIFDGIEQLTYASAFSPPVSNLPAVRRPLTQSAQRNIQRFVTLAATDVVFHVDAAPLASTAMSAAAGDTVSDANGISYSVLFLEHQTLNNTIVLVCRP